MEKIPGPFLTAEWRHLAMLNYEIEPRELLPFLPRGTELDEWQGKTFVSMIGFLFLNTRLRGWKIPFHSNFEEVNLRFYVRRAVPDGLRRGVVFLKEIVPRRLIAWTARAFYNENYIAAPMWHEVPRGESEMTQKVFYAWKTAGRSHHLALRVQGKPAPIVPGSGEEFITDHYWGYARQRNGETVEYQVEHEPWRIWRAQEATLDCDVKKLYGDRLANYLSGAPASAFLAEGSPVTVFQGRKLVG